MPTNSCRRHRKHRSRMWSTRTTALRSRCTRICCRRPTPTPASTNHYARLRAHCRRRSDMDLRMTGLTAVISGGTKGIGRAAVEMFLEEGANVAFCARNADEVAAAESELSMIGPKVKGSALDVGDRDAL